MKCLVLYVVLPVLLFTAGLHAQDTGDVHDDRVSEASVNDARAGIAERVTIVEGVHRDTSSSVERERLGRVLAVLRETDLLWQQVSAALERRTGLRHELKTLTESGTADQPGTVVGQTSEQDISFRDFERLRSELEAEQAKSVTVQSALSAAEENLSEAKTQADQARRARRAEKEVLDTNSDPEKAVELAGALELVTVEVGRAEVMVTLRELELQSQRLSSQVHEQRRILLEQRVQRLEGRVRFRNDDLREVLGELEQREFEVSRELERAKVNLEYVQTRWFAARQQLDSSGADDSALAAQVEAKRLARQGRQAQVRLLAKELERLARMKQVWEQRYHVARGSASDEQKTIWEQVSHKVLDQLGRDGRLPDARFAELREDLGTINRRIQDADESGRQLVRWLEQQRRGVDFEVSVWERDRAIISEARALEQKFGAELGSGSVTVVQHLQWVWDSIAAIWSFELTSVEDRPITVGKIVSGLILLMLGVWLSRVISGYVVRRALVKVGLNVSASAAIQTVVFYVLVLTFTLFALHLVNVPLGVFTVLGGAVAIGVGFGSQNVMNNFISGLILLAERPIKIKDLVQVGDLYGTIERIGARSTQVRTSANIHIIVPNSAFLEQNVINWTLTDHEVRTMVSIGVAYGSDVGLVTDLLMRAAKEHGKVLSRPEVPTILFKDFGDNALVFELHFWIIMRSQMERLRIESEVRYRIDKLFDSAGVVIAFPQRDVHLDATSPLPVRVVHDEPFDEPSDVIGPSEVDLPG